MHRACASGLNVALRCTDDLERVVVAREETGDNVDCERKAAVGRKGGGGTLAFLQLGK